MRYRATLCFAALLASVSVRAQSVRVIGLDDHGVEFSVADLAAMSRQTVALLSESGPSRRYEGVPLTVLLAKVGAPTGKDLRGAALAQTVIVTASDGYVVALALSDTDPGITDRRTILADRVEGRALPSNEGPFRLVVEGDLRPARAARMVATLRLLAAPPPPRGCGSTPRTCQKLPAK